MIEHKPDLAQEAVDKLLGVLKDKPRIEELLRILTAQLQELEDVHRDLLTNRLVDTAEGEQLDVLGRIVKQPREGRDDDTYRLWIKARTVLNRSAGRPPDIALIMSLVLEGRELHLVPGYPASFRIEVHGATDAETAADAADILHLATGAGIGSELITSLADDGETFTFSDDDTATADTDRGFGDDLDPGVGGVFADTSGL